MTARIARMDPAVSPPARGNHAAVVVDDVMYVFGGEDNQSNLLGDFWFVHLLF
jgi:hypothetical protein